MDAVRQMSCIGTQVESTFQVQYSEQPSESFDGCFEIRPNSGGISRLDTLRWIPVLIASALFSPAVHADEPGDSFWRSEDGSAHLIVLQGGQEIAFSLVVDGQRRCEAPGIARQAEDGRHFLFRNQPAYWRWKQGHESYGVPEENGSCVIRFDFSVDRVTVGSTGNCRSFCGVGGSLDVTLAKVSP